MANRLSPEQFQVTTLGPCTVPSPLGLSTHVGDGLAHFVPDGTRILYKIAGEGPEDFNLDLFMERAGPREHIFFDPAVTRAAVVTCGGLSPGVNNVMRSLVLELYFQYGVRDVVGFRYGFRGINPAHGLAPVRLDFETVRSIQNEGGSLLGVSRGAEDASVLVDRLIDMDIDILFCIGGDGTLRGAHAIVQELHKRKRMTSIICIPKTIDNDVPFVYKSFGFDTAVEVVSQAIDGAHVEATSTMNGIGLVRVMGRDSGFIAAYGCLASGQVNFCLVPEVPFDLHGEGGFLDILGKRLERHGHAVIVVAEGAGQQFFPDRAREYDASGNLVPHDIGVYLREEITRYLKARQLTFAMKYIDPSYMIRSVGANASDAIFCDNLARNAVHAGMAGKTDAVIGLWHGIYTHVPIPLTVRGRRHIHPESYLWRSVVAATGQPMQMRSRTRL
ncbi:MAG TPA: ATP-dependent 6-phosphofructokinase [Candidatus Krumholzibacteria bacterium]|nr:ATP-dependent 6-phosphofructokinase [Candidatus Krumholzibacteria bacterium]